MQFRWGLAWAAAACCDQAVHSRTRGGGGLVFNEQSWAWAVGIASFYRKPTTAHWIQSGLYLACVAVGIAYAPARRADINRPKFTTEHFLTPPPPAPPKLHLTYSSRYRRVIAFPASLEARWNWVGCAGAFQVGGYIFLFWLPDCYRPSLLSPLELAFLLTITACWNIRVGLVRIYFLSSSN